MRYIDRNGTVTEEDTQQDRFLRHLYNDRGGRLCLRILVNPAVSVLGGCFLNSSVSKRMIPGFIQRNRIDLSEYEPKEYGSYNDFFTRKIRPGMRPLPEEGSALVSPCDGKVTVCPITDGQHFRIKETEYTLEELLKNRALAERYAGGTALIIRLTVDNYHHYIYPASGRKSRQVRIKGVLHTVNPAANDVCPIYAENSRGYCLIRTEEFGTLLQMEVGALMVGKITNFHPGEEKVSRGEEKGCFEFGGSTVILLVRKGKAVIDSDLLENTAGGYETMIKMGEKIGESQLSERT